MIHTYIITGLTCKKSNALLKKALHFFEYKTFGCLIKTYNL